MLLIMVNKEHPLALSSGCKYFRYLDSSHTTVIVSIILQVLITIKYHIIPLQRHVTSRVHVPLTVVVKPYFLFIYVLQNSGKGDHSFLKSKFVYYMELNILVKNIFKHITLTLLSLVSIPGPSVLLCVHYQ